MWASKQWFVPLSGGASHVLPERVPDDPEEAARFWCMWDNHPMDPGQPVHAILLAYHAPQITHIVGTASNRVHFVREGLSLQEAQAALAEKRCDVVPGNDWTTEGLFCSPGCAMAYRQAFPRPEYADHEQLWAERWRQQHPEGGDPPALIAAPHYACLERHGGPLTIAEFRRVARCTGTPELIIENSTALHSPFGTAYRAQRIYSASYVTPESHARRAQAREAAAGHEEGAPAGDGKKERERGRGRPAKR